MPAKPNYYIYFTPFGPITIGARGKCVTAVLLGKQPLAGELRPSEVTNRCATQLLQYLGGKRKGFDVPLSLEGSPFQKKVWAAVGKVPYGQARTSSQIAAAIGAPESARQIGSALAACPVAVLVPVHRIVRADGRTRGEDKQARLRAACLALERRVLAEARR